MTQSNTFNPTVLADPGSFALNRLPVHSDHGWFASEEEANAKHSALTTPLDGVWKYHHAQRPTNVPEGLENPETDITAWDDIQVPSHIQLSGYDKPQYVNKQYPWDGHENLNPGEIPTLFNPVSTYARDVQFPKIEQGESLRFIAEGAESALALWVDGDFIGYATDSFLPSEFDVTSYADGAKHRIVCRVWKWSSGSWLESQDFMRFSGLFRSVRLTKVPRTHIEDIRVSVHLLEDHSSAQISLDLSGRGLENGTVQASLEGVGDFAKDGNKLTITVQGPHLWSAEDPHLYNARILVKNSDGTLDEVIDQRIGIRNVSIDSGILLINGKRALLKGVNRHDFSLNGRVPNPELIRRDLIELKRLGVNAIRTSHYPNPKIFYELADELGFYVIDEASIETHAMWERVIRGLDTIEEAFPGDREEWRPAVSDRVTSMVRRDKNHPSVVMWSLGNESLGGTVLRDVANEVRALDSRPIHYEGVYWDSRYLETSDVYSQMYTSAADVEKFLQTHSDKPFILCEFAHAMGNSFGAVDKYMDLSKKEPHFQGLFVWDFADQALIAKDEYGREFLGYGGDFGEPTHDADFSGNGLFFADHTPKPQTAALKALYSPLAIEIDEGGFRVRNDYEVTDTSQLVCELSLEREGVLLATAQVEVELAPGETGEYPLPFVLPQQSGEYAIDVSFTLRAPTAWAPAGFEVAREQHVFRVAEAANPHASVFEQANPVGVSEVPDGLTLVDSTNNIGVRGEGFEVIFSRSAGGIQAYMVGPHGARARQVLRGLPSVNMWHAPTSNERGWNAPMQDAQWLVASRYSKIRGGTEPFTVTVTERSVNVSWTLDLASSPASTCDMEAKVFADSTLVLRARLNPGEGLADPPEFGFLIPVDPSLTQVNWYGEGPGEAAVDRRQGAFLGRYAADVREMLTPYLRPQEAGSRTGVRWARLTDESGFGIELFAAQPMEFSALPASPFEIENAMHIDELGPHRRTWLRPALMRRGVGGDDSWGAKTHEEYLLRTGPLEFSVAMRAIKGGE
ncbi:MAG: glycoside hydrolase family 2 TIM barrel-domain containing protein [Actinomycetaceae bacterium]|nr:glycoside hydrolase family 2 TIM barrel-domain containing protein [Actinomycetaceae bacterium]